MKQLKIAMLTITLFSAAQSKTAAHEEVRVTHNDGKITITYDNRQTSVTEEQLQLSGTLKNVLSDCPDQIEEVIKRSFPENNPALSSHIIPVLELLPHVATIHALPSKEEKAAAQSKLTEQLKQRTTEELINLMLTANYLDVQTIIDTTAQILADRLSTPEALADFQKNKNAFLKPFEELPNEMQVAISKHMLPQYQHKFSLKYKKITRRNYLFSPDSKLRVTYDPSNHYSHIHDTETDELLHTVPRLDLQFSPDSKLIATCDLSNHHSYMYDTETWNPPHTVPGIWPEFSPDSKLIVTYDHSNHRSYMHDTKTGHLLYTVPGRGALFSPDSKLIVTYDRSYTYDDFNDRSYIHDTETGHFRYTVPRGGALFSPDGKLIVTHNHSNHRSYMHDTKTGDFRYTVPGKRPLFSPDGKLIAIYDHFNHRSYMHDTKTWHFLYTVPGKLPEFSPDGKLIVPQQDNNIQIYQTESILQLKKALTRQDIKSTMNLLLYITMKDKKTNIMPHQQQELFKIIPEEIKRHLQKPTTWWQQLQSNKWKALAVSTAAVIGSYLWYKWASK